ncbi:hypothetical protein OSB04_015021 [Centaurea solstitialis]|uniref:Diacylglycerol O-acyltransferase n=1 Tax=Centaurea solstitialis TaxID=347529 RepID=A0AA38T9D7_9ASTR|nr:hypothetical protein OSB04_015021 [Centaurea solstitialis]
MVYRLNNGGDGLQRWKWVSGDGLWWLQRRYWVSGECSRSPATSPAMVYRLNNGGDGLQWWQWISGDGLWWLQRRYWVSGECSVSPATSPAKVENLYESSKMMGKTPDLKPLKLIQTTQDHKERFDEEKDDEQPLSPVARLFHEPGANIYIIAIIGMKTTINPDVFKANILNSMYLNHRYSSLQVLDKENGKMKWVPTKVNLDDHVIVPKLDPNMELGDKFVEDYISNLSKSQIDNSKPLWDLHILNTKTLDAQGTCVLRVHHSLGDGMSLVNLLLACSRKASDPEALPSLPGDNKSGRQVKLVTSFRSLVMVIWNTIVALVMFISTLLFLKDTKTPLSGYPGIEDSPRRIVFTTVSFDDIKLVKKAMDVAFTGATKQHGSRGNKIAYVLLPFDIKYKKDLLDYVREVKTDMARKKTSLEPLCTSFLANLVIKFFGVKFAGKLNHKVYSNTTFALSNVPGPQEHISLFGHEVNYIAPSCYGQPMALLINVVSYVDKVTFVLSVDEETIPDPQNLCHELQQSLHLIKSSILAGV